MKEEIKPDIKKTGQAPDTEKVPWLFTLEVKDLIKPITIRRVHLLYAAATLVLLIAAGAYLWDNYLRGPSGEELVAEMVDAAGGMAAWNAIQQGQFDRTQNLYSQNGELLTTKTETFYFKKTQEGVKLQVRSYDNEGKEVWIGKDQDGYWASRDREAVDPKLTARGMGMMCDSKWCEPLCASSMAFYRFSMPFKLTDQGVIPEVVGSSVFAILDFNPLEYLDIIEPIILNITYAPEVGKDHWRFLVNPETKLIHKVEYYNKSDFGEIRPEEIYWTDHREEFGITFSHRWTRYWSNGEVMEEYVYSNVDFETAIADTFFKRPAGHVWLTSR